MKKKITIIAVVAVCLFVTAGVYFISRIGCTGDCAQPMYSMGTVYEFDESYDMLIFDDKNEQFIYICTSKYSNDENRFGFSFDPNWDFEEGGDRDSYFEQIGQSAEHPYAVSNKEFDFTDQNGNKIILNDGEGYYFHGSAMFYISYKNANPIIKDRILNHSFMICISGLCFK